MTYDTGFAPERPRAGNLLEARPKSGRIMAEPSDPVKVVANRGDQRSVSVAPATRHAQSKM